MNEESQLSLAPDRQLSAPSPEPSTAQLLSAVLSRGDITTATVEVVERLSALMERQDARNAERAFASAFVKMQGGIERIFANKKADRYSYAPYEEIMSKAKPILDECGFGLRFDSKLSEDGKIVTAFCFLMHSEGHTVTNQYSVRIGSKAPGLSEPQIDGVAGTFARRYALCNALNIVVETDTDGRKQGGKITRDQVAELRALMTEVGSNEANVLNSAGVAKIEDLNEQAFEVICTMLAVKRKKKPAATEVHDADQQF